MTEGGRGECGKRKGGERGRGLARMSNSGGDLESGAAVFYRQRKETGGNKGPSIRQHTNNKIRAPVPHQQTSHGSVLLLIGRGNEPGLLLAGAYMFQLTI